MAEKKKINEVFTVSFDGPAFKDSEETKDKGACEVLSAEKRDTGKTGVEKTSAGKDSVDDVVLRSVFAVINLCKTVSKGIYGEDAYVRIQFDDNGRKDRFTVRILGEYEDSEDIDAHRGHTVHGTIMEVMKLWVWAKGANIKVVEEGEGAV